jgi:signal transduction histidine kinase
MQPHTPMLANHRVGGQLRRKQMLKMQTLDPNTVVANISQMLGRLLGENIHITLHLDANLGQIQADPTQLEQVLVNMAVNARDAMPNGGHLVIETCNTEIDQRSSLAQGVPPGRYVVLVITDTGCGMDESTRLSAFEPFFTTKEVGKGTGLGLSMVLGVVQQSGGTVTVYSEHTNEARKYRDDACWVSGLAGPRFDAHPNHREKRYLRGGHSNFLCALAE